MDERDKTKIGEFFFAPVRDGDLGRALECNLAFVRGKRVCRHAFDQPATLDTADSRAPTILSKGVGQARTESVRGVTPEILAVVPAVHVFLEIEGLHRHGFGTVRQTGQDVRGRVRPT